MSHAAAAARAGQARRLELVLDLPHGTVLKPLARLLPQVLSRTPPWDPVLPTVLHRSPMAPCLPQLLTEVGLRGLEQPAQTAGVTAGAGPGRGSCAGGAVHSHCGSSWERSLNCPFPGVLGEP